MSDSVRRFRDDKGRVWRAVLLQTGGITLGANARGSTSSTLVFRPDDADRPRLQIVVQREMWHIKQFTDAELRAQLAFAHEFGSFEK